MAQKLTQRTAITSGLTSADLMHLVNDGDSWKVSLSVLLDAFVGFLGFGIASDGADLNVACTRNIYLTPLSDDPGTGLFKVLGTMKSGRFASENGSSGYEIFATDDEAVNYRKLRMDYEGGRYALLSLRGGDQNASSINLGLIGIPSPGFGSAESHIFINNPDLGGNTPAFQNWVTDIFVTKEIGVFRYYNGQDARLKQTAGDNSFVEISPFYDQETGNASNADFRVVRRGVNFGSGVQRLLSLLTQDDDASDKVERFGVDIEGTPILGNEAAAETPPATHTMIIKDNTGTSYKILCTPA